MHACKVPPQGQAGKSKTRGVWSELAQVSWSPYKTSVSLCNKRQSNKNNHKRTEEGKERWSWHRSAGAHTRRACHCVISARATQPQKDRRREVDSTHPLTLTESILTKSMGRTVGTDTSNMMPLNVWSSLSPVSCVVCSCTTWLTCKTRMQRSVHKYV
jgi:hypothetical protein